MAFDDTVTQSGRRLKSRLSAMMFLEYSVKGLWMPLAGILLVEQRTMGGLGFTESQKGMIIGIPLAIGSLLAPFVAGQLADRHFATQKCLAVMMFLAGILKWATAYQTSFAAWMALSICFAILYVPTVSLTNSLAMAHLNEPKAEFPSVRLWGTIGWIVVSWMFPMLWLQSDLQFQKLPPFFKGNDLPDVTARMLDSLKFAGGLAVAYAFFCWFFLPDTPPARLTRKKLAFLEAASMFRTRSFVVLMATALPISILHTLYFMNTAPFLKANGLQSGYVMPAMSLGQFSEIAALGLLGWVLKRAGFRVVMSIGSLCFALRFGIFGIPGIPVEILVAAQLLHGICFGCFYAAAFIYVERIAPPQVHHTAQTMFLFVMMGVAPAITGGWLNGFLADWCEAPGGVLDQASYAEFWQITSLIGFITSACFLILFRDETAADAHSGG